MSLIELAEAIDHWVESNQAYVVESGYAATVSAVSAEHASQVIVFCRTLGWDVNVFDSANEEWVSDEPLEAGFSPFRVAIQKPVSPDNSLQLLTNHAFAHYLKNGHAASRWYIARLTDPLALGTRIIQPWGGIQEPCFLPATKSPRALVKEFGNIRRVPEDVRNWLTSPLAFNQFSKPATQVWVCAAAVNLISCLPDEIDAESGALKFRGPPRLTLANFDLANDVLDHVTFNTLLKAVQWVFEHEREAEMRHILLAAELARSGMSTESTTVFLGQYLSHALESAQIAYQMALAETGRDTLKVLSDLRKAVTEETAKLSDISRQLTGSVAVAIATGIGLIAARIAANASAILVALVMIVVALYIVIVISSGVQFMRLQRQLRNDWQHRLYRFLPDAEYKRMVAIPTTKAECSFVWTAWLSGVAVAMLTLACCWVVFKPIPSWFSSKDIPVTSITLPSSNSTQATTPNPSTVGKPIASTIEPDKK